jgi:hypothetical protein
MPEDAIMILCIYSRAFSLSGLDYEITSTTFIAGLVV